MKRPRFAPPPPMPPHGYVRDGLELLAEDRARAQEVLPFPAADITKRQMELWVCKVPIPGHDPCTCWPAGMPTIEDAIQDLTLEQLGLKGKRVGLPQEREPLPLGDGLGGGGDE